jgi:S-adenosylhomocysteine hydrolase
MNTYQVIIEKVGSIAQCKLEVQADHMEVMPDGSLVFCNDVTELDVEKVKRSETSAVEEFQYSPSVNEFEIKRVDIVAVLAAGTWLFADIVNQDGSTVLWGENGFGDRQWPR